MHPEGCKVGDQKLIKTTLDGVSGRNNPIFYFQIAFQVSRYWSAVKVLKNNHHFILRQILQGCTN